MKLGLGTVQFGQPYGITNANRAVSSEEVKNILAFAANHNVDLLDTASAYGNSEEVLGMSNLASFDIVTKLQSLPGKGKVHEWVSRSINDSCEKLRQDKIYGLLLHRPQELLGAQGDLLYKALIEEKQTGRVSKIGISIYSPSELDDILKRFPVDLVQAPMNVFDTRLHTSGWLDRLNKLGVEIHIRSVFLQGLLLMSSEKMPGYFLRWQNAIRQWHDWLYQNGLRNVNACLQFLRQFDGIDRVLVGVVNQEQLAETVDSFEANKNIDFPDFSQTDTDLIEPSRWRIA